MEEKFDGRILKRFSGESVVLDERTQKYFDAIKRNIGYIGMNSSWTEIQEVLKQKNINYEIVGTMHLSGLLGPTMASWDAEVIEYEVNGSKRWAVQYSYQTDIDDYVVESLIFSTEPNVHNVELARLIEEFRMDLFMGRISLEFTCWECNRKVHWLDGGKGIPFKERYNRLKEKYCGC